MRKLRPKWLNWPRLTTSLLIPIQFISARRQDSWLPVQCTFLTIAAFSCISCWSILASYCQNSSVHNRSTEWLLKTNTSLKYWKSRAEWYRFLYIIYLYYMQNSNHLIFLINWSLSKWYHGNKLSDKVIFMNQSLILVYKVFNALVRWRIFIFMVC